jgi:hypothetical protein
MTKSRPDRRAALVSSEYLDGFHREEREGREERLFAFLAYFAVKNSRYAFRG